MIFTDKDGREIELEVSGRYEDDVQIDNAWYTNADDKEDVTDDTLDYIRDTQGDKLVDLWFEHQRDEADFRYDQWKETRHETDKDKS